MVKQQRFFWHVAAVFVVFALCGGAYAQSSTLDQQAREIEGLLMAPCCWGSTVAEHDSQAAIDIKEGIRRMLSQGQTKAQILAHYEALHGERVLSFPKKSGFNLLAWIFPVVIFLLGSSVLTLFLRSQRRKKMQKAESAEASPQKSSLQDEKYLKELDKELYGA